MEYGIQRRSIYLLPPTPEDVGWFLKQFDDPEVYEMFGFGQPSRVKLMRAYRGGDLVVGILHKVEGRKRIGFVIMFPPAGQFDFWEFGYDIPDPKDRDAFCAFNATDAMAHYMFEHLRVTAMGWRTREDNRAADAVVRRLGYKPYETSFQDGHNYTFYRLDQAGWAQRRAKLDRGEASHPSGIGATFVTLMPPYEPIEPKLPEGGSSDAEARGDAPVSATSEGR
ncbi:GNAT family N-acetyltransferase [Myxococcota bacterium]|nr:GNAT family N-acetyltransferase [Myxococcota bacterium]